MRMDLDDLSCPSCGGYVHPFLGACPACGASRRSRYADAAVDPDLRIRSLFDEPRVTNHVREVSLRYSLKRSGGPVSTELREGLATIADALAYDARVVGAQEAASRQAHVEIGVEALVVRERNPNREIARVPFDTILAIAHATKDGGRAGAWSGLVFDGRRDPAPLPPLDGDLVVTFASPAGLGRLALANRRGILASRAGPDHYATMGRWLGILAAADAEARWTAVGVRRHAAELGLAPPIDAAADPGTGDAARTAGGGGAAAEAGAVRAALEALEGLRTAGLVTDGEYAAKRREILARL